MWINKYRFLILSTLLIILCTYPLVSQEYLLGPDDVINISVFREPELDRDVRIAPDGTIVFPLIGKVKVDGLTLSQLIDKLTDEFSEYIIEPQVAVFIKEYTNIYVSGEVKKPGSYPLQGKLTVIEAISLAGGFTEIAGRNNVIILRIENGKKKTIRVRVESIRRKGDKSKDIPLKRGDIVFVPESLF